MNILKYLLLGIIQGITEPLPISSSGHIVILKEIFNTNFFNDLNFEIFVNFGSFIAIFLIFYKDIINIIKDFFKYITDEKSRKKTVINFKYAWLICISTIPVGLIGFLFKDFFEEKLAVPQVIGVAFLFTASCLFLIRKIKGEKEDKDITIKDAIIIGLMEVISLVPGVSRSGIVLVGCLLCNIKKENALKYTFMLYFPVSIATFLLSLIDLFKSHLLGSLILPYLIGMIASFIVTFFTYKWLSNIVKKGRVWLFSIYLIIISLFVLIYFR